MTGVAVHRSSGATPGEGGLVFCSCDLPTQVLIIAVRNRAREMAAPSEVPRFGEKTAKDTTRVAVLPPQFAR